MVEVGVDGIFGLRDSAKVFELTDLRVCLSGVQSQSEGAETWDSP